MSSGAPRSDAGIGRHLELELRGHGKGVPVAGNRRMQQLAQIEIHPLRLLDALLDPAAAPSALKIDCRRTAPSRARMR